MKRPRRDKQNMVRRHHPILRIHRRPLNNRQNIPLHAFAAHIRPMPAPSRPAILSISSRNTIPELLHPLHRQLRVTWSISISRPSSSCTSIVERLHHLHLALLHPLPKQSRQHVLQRHIPSSCPPLGPGRKAQTAAGSCPAHQSPPSAHPACPRETAAAASPGSSHKE